MDCTIYSLAEKGGIKSVIPPFCVLIILKNELKTGLAIYLQSVDEQPTPFVLP